VAEHRDRGIRIMLRGHSGQIGVEAAVELVTVCGPGHARFEVAGGPRPDDVDIGAYGLLIGAPFEVARLDLVDAGKHHPVHLAANAREWGGRLLRANQARRVDAVDPLGCQSLRHCGRLHSAQLGERRAGSGRVELAAHIRGRLPVPDQKESHPPQPTDGGRRRLATRLETVVRRCSTSPAPL
jgi:hypothetical protein